MTKYDEYEIEDKLLEAGRDQDHKKKNKRAVPGAWELFSVNDLW